MGFRLAVRAVAGTEIFDRAQPLDDAVEGASPVDPVLIGNDLEPAQSVSQQLSLAKKMVGIPWTVEALIAARESLVDENPAGFQGIEQRREQGAKEVIHYHDARESLVAEGPSPAILQIGTDDIDIRPPVEVGDSLNIAVDANRGMSP